MARNMAGPLLFLNLVLYCIVVGFSSWCINRYINGQSAHPGVGGKWCDDVLPRVCALGGCGRDSLEVAGRPPRQGMAGRQFGCGCYYFGGGIRHHRSCLWVGMERDKCGRVQRMERLRVLEAFVIIVTISQFLYVLALHAGHFSSRYRPGYRDTPYSGGIKHKGGSGMTGARV